MLERRRDVRDRLPRLRARVGMVFQHSRPLNRQTVLENIMVALLPDSLFMLFPDKALTERAKWIAERVGLGARLAQITDGRVRWIKAEAS